MQSCTAGLDGCCTRCCQCTTQPLTQQCSNCRLNPCRQEQLQIAVQQQIETCKVAMWLASDQERLPVLAYRRRRTCWSRWDTPKTYSWRLCMVAVMSALAAKLRRLLCSAASAEQGRLLRFLWQVWLWLSKQLCWLMQMGMRKVWGWASFMTGGCRYRLAEKLMPSCQKHQTTVCLR